MGMFAVLDLKSKKLLKVATAHGALWSGHTKSECEKIDLPKTKENFIKTAAYLGIEWDIDDVLSADDFSSLQLWRLLFHLDCH